ncbi:hypothetical protein [Alkalicoccus daliensis]|uniref:Uncharacterized protein n=1 Tax=Alkalicoccus daliensis TaxID=745820 RepID=A0A1H0H4D3_9BACI|nr:hypothetical protein [Alkalicoccus daliensis]SDO13771.1 hypothetical protein SAMN04488053_107168 [Alkalicoccus daliensis]
MHQITLGHLVQHVSPDWLLLLTDNERTKDIVLRNGVENVKEEDVMEIMEAVISEHASETLYH